MFHSDNAEDDILMNFSPLPFSDFRTGWTAQSLTSALRTFQYLVGATVLRNTDFSVASFASRRHNLSRHHG
jgi:hypothetical protein